jgi:hypothetical protein
MRVNEAGTGIGLLAQPAECCWRRRISEILLIATTIGLAACASHPSPETPIPPLVIFFVDGMRLSEVAADSLWESTDLGRDADSVRVLKDPEALSRYGAKGRPGVVLIYLRGGEGVWSSDRRESDGVR